MDLLQLEEAILSATNIKSIHYERYSQEWEIKYYNGKTDYIATELLWDHLEENA